MKYLRIYRDKWGRRRISEQVEVERSLSERCL